MLHGQLPGCPGVDGTGCSSQLVFYPPKDKKVGHHGVGRYKCLGGYDSSEGYTTCRFKCTDGPCPAVRPPWQFKSAAAIRKELAAAEAAMKERWRLGRLEAKEPRQEAGPPTLVD